MVFILSILIVCILGALLATLLFEPLKFVFGSIFNLLLKPFRKEDVDEKD